MAIRLNVDLPKKNQIFEIEGQEYTLKLTPRELMGKITAASKTVDGLKSANTPEAVSEALLKSDKEAEALIDEMFGVGSAKKIDAGRGLTFNHYFLVIKAVSDEINQTQKSETMLKYNA